MMHFEQPPRGDDGEARILPLINVVVLLLIFFIVAGSLSAIDPFEVEAPESLSESATERDVLRLLLGEDGQLALDDEVLDETSLLMQVKARIAADPDLQIQLKADADAPGNRVVVLMEGLREAGVERLRLLTLPAKQGS